MYDFVNEICNSYFVTSTRRVFDFTQVFTYVKVVVGVRQDVVFENMT